MTGTRRAGKARPAAPGPAAPPTRRAPRAGQAPRHPEPAPPALEAPRGPAPRRPDPAPIEVDESRVILIGVICWAIAFVVMLPLHSKLSDHGNGWYPWTALAGIGLGCWGWYLVRKRVAERNAGKH